MLTKEFVIATARSLDFDLCGFSEIATLKDESERYNGWLKNGYHAGMNYMERNLDIRFDAAKYFPEAKSIISLGINYYHSISNHSTASLKISRYAQGKDYHLVMWNKLEEFVEILKNKQPDFSAKYHVDTGPVMDKAWAVRSGIGWMGKNGNIINRSIGSWFFIATVVTNQMFESDSLYKPSCGNCTTCLDACPTKAIVVPYVIDSNLCISYQTIESKQDIPEFLMGKFDNWIFGCDICQEVCPWNVKFQKQTKIRDFIPHKNADHLNLESIQSMTKEKFSELFGSSSVKRTKLSGLKRNADFVSKEI